MSGGHAVWRPFKVNGSYTRCTVCRQSFSHEERVQANPPTAEQPGWKNIRCYPNCTQAAKSRIPSKRKVPPSPIFFNNQFATTRCCLCNSRIAVGARMKATKHGEMWSDKQHHPRCPEPANSPRRSGASAIDSALGGGRHVSSPPGAEDPARKRPRSGPTEESVRSKRERRGGGGAAAASARPDSGAQSGSRSRPAPPRPGPTTGTAAAGFEEVECVRALTSTERIDERISQRQRELGVVDVEDDDDDDDAVAAAASRRRSLAATEGGWGVDLSSSRSRPLPAVVNKARRSKANHAAASCRNLAVTEGWLVDSSSSRSRPLPVAKAERSRKG
ncbi:unnamed protein product [Ectocarpus fasciculatus]